MVDRGGLGILGLLVQVQAEVLDAAGQQGVRVVALLPGSEEPLAGQGQVLIPVRRVVRVLVHDLFIQLSITHTEKK